MQAAKEELATLPREREWLAQKVETWETSTHELALSLKSSLSQLKGGGTPTPAASVYTGAKRLMELPLEILCKILGYVPIHHIFGKWCAANAQAYGAKLDISVWTSKLKRAHLTVNENQLEFDGLGWMDYMRNCLYCSYR